MRAPRADTIRVGKMQRCTPVNAKVWESTRASSHNGEPPHGTQGPARLSQEPGAMPEGPYREGHQTATGKHQGNRDVPFDVGQPRGKTCFPLRSRRHSSGFRSRGVFPYAFNVGTHSDANNRPCVHAALQVRPMRNEGGRLIRWRLRANRPRPRKRLIST
jgi:hypothetical protein